MNATDQIINNILETRFESIDNKTIHRAKEEVIDTIGCALGGANDIGSPAVVDLVREWGGSKESTVLGYGFKAPAHHAAMANAIMARSFDFGMVDLFVEGEVKPAHIGETLVPVALAIAEQKGLSGKQLLTALIVAEDLVSRLIAAPTEKLGGFDTTGTADTFGATALSGKLLGLDAVQMLYAFGIALNQMGGSTAGLNDKTSCWKLNQGLSAQRGIVSAKMAAKGFVGVKDPIFGKCGYFDLYTKDHKDEKLTNDLGKKYYTEVTFKPYPQCRGTHGATDAALEVARKNNIDPNNIDEVHVIVHTNSVPVRLRDEFEFGLVPHVSAIFSLQYTVANALLRGYSKPQHFTDEAIKDPKISELIKKIKMSTQDFPPSETFLCATVKVKMKDGKELSEHVNVPSGNDLENPLSKELKREKYLNNVAFTKKVNVKNAEKAMNIMEKLEDVENINQVIKLLV
jgi:2-methylcitrate dehydratase PrpD